MSEQITQSIIIKAAPQEVYSVLTNFGGYSGFAPQIRRIQRGAGDLVHVTLDGPLGKQVDLDVEITKADPDQRIGWNTKDNEADITTSGQVVLAELPDNQTNVTATVNYEGGFLTSLLQRNPEEKLELVLRRLKEYVEGGHHRMGH